MRIIFMGSPEYAIESLTALLNSKHQVIAVATQPDAPSGRGHKLAPSPIKKFAQSKGIPVLDYPKISRDGIAEIKEMQPDLIITVAYGQILSGELISVPKYGVINAHASILPKFRGASPIQAAIAAGETETGITIVQTELGLDTGDIILIKKTEIGENETAGELANRLAKLSASAILSALELIENGKVRPKPQNHEDASISTKLTKIDSIINWNRRAKQIMLQILSQNPSPISRSNIEGMQVKIYRAELAKGLENTNVKPGTIVEPSSAKNGVFVQCGNGVLELKEVSIPNGKAMDAKNLMMSDKLKIGMCFDQFSMGFEN